MELTFLLNVHSQYIYYRNLRFKILYINTNAITQVTVRNLGVSYSSQASCVPHDCRVTILIKLNSAHEMAGHTL